MLSRFSWDEPLVDDDGMVLSQRRLDRWLQAAVRRFRKSPEGQQAPESGWLESVFRLGVQYEGRAPSDFRPDLLADVLLDVLPRKVVMEPSEAAPLVAELRAFFAFAARSFGAADAAACAEWLTPAVARSLQSRLADPSAFGLAKSFFVGGGSIPGRSPLEQVLEGLGGLDGVYDGSDRPKPVRKAVRTKKKRKQKQAKKSRRKNR